MKIEEIRTHILTLSVLGGLALWGSANIVFSEDLEQRMEPIQEQLKQLRVENLEEKILELTTEIAVLEYRKEHGEWTGEDEVRLSTMLEQRKQLKKKLEE